MPLTYAWFSITASFDCRGVKDILNYCLTVLRKVLVADRQNSCRIFLKFNLTLFLGGGWIGSRIDGFGRKERTHCGVKRKIERICGFRKCGGSRISCEFGPGQLRTAPVKKFGSWILNELRIVDLRRSLSVCWHFLHYVWDKPFFLPKILKMSMSFTFTVFVSLKRNLHAYVSFSKGIKWQNKHQIYPSLQ